MQVLSRVTRLARYLDRERRSAFGAHGLEKREFDVLAALRRAGPGARSQPGQLIRETMVTSGTMTNRVDRLGARGLVTREPHLGDRRVVLVGLTEEGRQGVEAGCRGPDGRRSAEPRPTWLRSHRRPLAVALRELLAPYRDHPLPSPYGD